MLSLLVYKFDGKYYVVLFGGTEGFQKKEDVFLIGTEEEVFTITHTPGTPFLEVVRQLIAELDRREIKDPLCLEAIFSAGKAQGQQDPTTN